ncbi:MAG: IS1634 family transposase, partial [Chloroflexota bacterium]|nr:IS1634 family transposase [Chloroflexota bacterium]
KMDTQQITTRTERVDDIPLLLAQMHKIGLASFIDKHFPTHGNWQGLSIGQVTTGWLSYILSSGDHCLNHVESWAEQLLVTLSTRLEAEVRALDFSDDRLATLLDYLAQDEEWEDFECTLNSNILRVYNLKAERVRIDTTTAKSYVEVNEDGLFQFGYSKDHRPDLPQLKISPSALEPLGLPVTTTVVSGNRADDPLYIPEIKRVQTSLGIPGVLYIGDSKMGSLETRAYIAHTRDYYLCPLSALQVPQEELERLLEPVWHQEQILSTVYRPRCQEEIDRGDTAEALAEGFAYEETLRAYVEGKEIEWREQRLVVRSKKHAQRQQKALDTRLQQAQAEIAKLNVRGRKVLKGDELHSAVDKLLAKYRVEGMVTPSYHTETRTRHKRAYRNRPAQTIANSETTVYSEIDPLAYQHAVRCLGFRVYVSNDMRLSLNEAVLAYREEYRIERGFGRYKGQVLGLTPLYLTGEDRIKGLIRLLSIGLRLLCLLEFGVRKALSERAEKLAGIYRGNPKRATANPTAEMMLKAFMWVSLTELELNGTKRRYLSVLSTVQKRILALLDLPVTIYWELTHEFVELGYEMSEP